VELAARLLRLAGVSAEVKKVGGRDEWQVWATTGRLAAGHKEPREALAELVEKARGNGWVDAGKAEQWLEKLEGGVTLREGWPRHYVGLVMGALVVKFGSTDPVSIEDEAQRFRDMGLKEGKHFSVEMPEGGDAGYLYILREGLKHAAWLSVHGEGEQRKLAARFVELLQRAREEVEEVYKKVEKIIDEGKARGSLTLKGFEKEVEVDGRRHKVKVIDGGAVEEGEGGRKLLRIRITAEVDGVRRDYEIAYRYEGNAAVGRAVAKTDVPGGREEDARRLAAVIKALTGR
jgi:hypothetical protein